MIERYTNPELGAIWTDQAKYDAWWEVEKAALRAMSDLGIVPAAEAKKVLEFPVKIDPARVDEIERTTRHDVIAFLTHVEEQAGEAARWVHFGMTSSDVLDTAFALQLKRANQIILADLAVLLDTLRERAVEFKDQPMMGRTHGIHAEPTTFGLVLLGHYAEFLRHAERFVAARKEVEVGMVSGAVGTYAHIPPEVEARACAELGLGVEAVSTQVIARDRHAAYFAVLAGIGAGIERLAVTLRHLQRTEVREVEESFAKGQKGSSAMPHKKNPISAENLCGLARLLRSNAQAAFENVALWHERDISHSSVERVIGPDSTILADYMLKRLTKLVSGLGVHPENMKKNLEQMRGMHFSQSLLLALATKGMERQRAYELVQRASMKVWEREGLTLKDAALAEPGLVDALGKDGIEEALDLGRHLRHTDAAFIRVLKKDGKP